MKQNEKQKTKKKKGGRGKWILPAVLLLTGLLCLPGCVYIRKEHQEVRSLPLDGVDFSRLADGVYPCENPGGMYGWRAARVEVVVEGGRVTEIRILETAEEADFQTLAARIVAAQSLEVDGISGASLTSRGFLHTVEMALIPAVKS